MGQSYDVDASALGSALRDLPGVVDARLEPDVTGGPGILRVRLAPGAHEGEVLAAATAVLRDRFSLGLDGGRLRVVDSVGRPVSAVVERAPAGATAAVPAPEPAPEPATHRLLLDRVEVVTSRLEVRAVVTLLLDGHEHAGEASASASPTGGQRVLSLATARAAQSALGGAARVDVEAVDLLPVGGDQVAVVVVTLLSGRGVERLSGAALARDDTREAFVRATLDALNRRVETHLPRSVEGP